MVGLYRLQIQIDTLQSGMQPLLSEEGVGARHAVWHWSWVRNREAW